MPRPGAASIVSRPPVGIFIMCDKTDAKTNYWVLSFHAVFGRSKPKRKAEAKKIATVVTKFLATKGKVGTDTNLSAKNVIVGGDWNLTKAEIEAEITAAGYTFYIAGKTSVNRSGVTVSNYDHFVLKKDTARKDLQAVNILGYGKYNQTTLKNFRANVTDHLGIVGDAD